MGRRYRRWRLRGSGARWTNAGGGRRQRTGLAHSPDGGIAAALAIAQNAIVGGNDIRFDAVLVKTLERLTHIADQSEDTEFLFLWVGRREFHLPEIFNVIKESNAVPVNSGVFTDLADHADLGFLVAFGPSKNHLLFRTKLVLGEKTCTVQAEENGLRLLGENLARQIGADQDDGNLLGDASASAHNLQGQERGHKQGARGPISYPGLSSKLSVFSVEAPVWDTEQASPFE